MVYLLVSLCCYLVILLDDILYTKSLKNVSLPQVNVGDTVETVRFFHCYKRGVDRVFVDHPMFLEKVC